MDHHAIEMALAFHHQNVAIGREPLKDQDPGVFGAFAVPLN